MSEDNMLTQDEIDALLNGSANDGSSKSSSGEEVNVNEYFSDMELDTLGEIGNISFGSSATALSALLNQKVEITTPSVDLIMRTRLAEEFPKPYVAVEVQYTEGFAGSNLLVIKQSDAAIIADLMLGGNGLAAAMELNEIQISAVQEAMNQMMGSAATSMSSIFQKKIDISPPNLDLLNLLEGEGAHIIPQDDILVRISFRLRVGELIDSSIMQLFSLPFAKSLTKDLLNNDENSVESSYNNTAESSSSTSNSQKTEPEAYVSAMSESYDAHAPVSAPVTSYQEKPKAPPRDVSAATFSSFEPTMNLPEKESRNLDMLLDIPLQVTVELGRTKKTIQEILELAPGSIIELDKLAGEPVDILINNKLIAKGEVVVIEENFGVRVTDIVSRRERINKLR